MGSLFAPWPLCKLSYKAAAEREKLLALGFAARRPASFHHLRKLAPAFFAQAALAGFLGCRFLTRGGYSSGATTTTATVLANASPTSARGGCDARTTFGRHGTTTASAAIAFTFTTSDCPSARRARARAHGAATRRASATEQVREPTLQLFDLTSHSYSFFQLFYR